MSFEIRIHFQRVPSSPDYNGQHFFPWYTKQWCDFQLRVSGSASVFRDNWEQGDPQTLTVRQHGHSTVRVSGWVPLPSSYFSAGAKAGGWPVLWPGEVLALPSLTLLHTFSVSTCKVDTTFIWGPGTAGLLGFRLLNPPYRRIIQGGSHPGASSHCPGSCKRMGAWMILLISSHIFCSTHFAS